MNNFEYKLYDICYSIIGFAEKIKYMVEHIRFLWVTNAVRIWDYEYLLDVIEFRLRKLHKAMEEDDVHPDRDKCISSLTKCISQFDIYNDVEKTYEEKQKAYKEIFKLMSKNLHKWYT